ncbi:MAG: 5-oxoprolinase subunit PxpB [Planctomycetaceae bacterium]
MAVIDVGDRGVAITVAEPTPAMRMAVVRGLTQMLLDARIAGVTDVVPSPGRVTAVYDPLTTSHAEVRRRVEEIAEATPVSTGDSSAAEHEIPVCYGGELGPDLAEVCAAHAIDAERLVEAHAAAEYAVEAIGFLPGFAYLSGLPPALATPRRATPRRLVPAGAVGIGGSQTGAYPFASPGGWNLIGHTPARLFDATQASPALLAVGDRVRFVPITPEEHRRRTHDGDGEPPRSRTPRVGVVVVAPGLFTTIQDLGRPGHRASGVPLSGAADPAALRLANRLVGNPEGAAALEVTLLGPTLRFERDAVVAVAGAVFPGCPWARPFRVSAGETLSLGHAVAGCRGVLAIAGGVAVEPVLGSRSTFVPARLGGLCGLPLAAGDVIPLGDASAGPTPALADPGPPPTASAVTTLRTIPGADFAACGDAIWKATHRTSSRSDRMGVRLEGQPLGRDRADGSLPSVAVLPGTVQLPPDGQPIILLADAQTIGGYPVIGHVIAADLPLVAQLRPGDVVRWQPSTIEEAHRAAREQDATARAVR